MANQPGTSATTTEEAAPLSFWRLHPVAAGLLVFASLPGLFISLAGIALAVSGSLRARAIVTLREDVLWRYISGSARDIDVARLRRAAAESAEIVDEQMPMAKSFLDREKLMLLALSHIDPKLKDNGLYCEFGVWQGTSINFIASHAGKTIHGFDSFEGLPEDWKAGAPAGAFRMIGLPPVRANVKLHVGWFDKSIPAWRQANTGPLAFVHLDADLYSSTKTVFDLLGDRFVAGTVIQFDELINYSGWKQGEWKAFSEFRKNRNADIQFLGYVNRGQPVAIKILKIDPVPVH